MEATTVGPSSLLPSAEPIQAVLTDDRSVGRRVHELTAPGPFVVAVPCKIDM